MVRRTVKALRSGLEAVRFSNSRPQYSNPLIIKYSLLSQRWSAHCLYLIGFDRFNSDACWNRFQFIQTKPNSVSS